MRRDVFEEQKLLKSEYKGRRENLRDEMNENLEVNKKREGDIYIVAGATKPCISKILNVQESQKTWRL